MTKVIVRINITIALDKKDIIFILFIFTWTTFRMN